MTQPLYLQQVVLVLREDYLAALTPPKKNELSPSIQMASGDIVIRSREIDEAKGMGRHYLYVSAEKESAKYGGLHEHDDFGSFIITADNDILMMDPPLFKTLNVIPFIFPAVIPAEINSEAL